MQGLAPKHFRKAGERGSVHRLVIAGLDMTIESVAPLHPAFEPFMVVPASSGATVLTVAMESVDEIGGLGRLVSREGQLSFWRDGGKVSVVLEGFDGGWIGCLTGGDGWRVAHLRIRAGADSEAVLKTVGEIHFRTVLACLGRGLVLHAAGVVCEGRGLAFVGCSGMGKSTQAGLWEQWRGAAILNEDRPAVTLGKTGPELHGTPWSGSSSKRLAQSVPLTALVLLDQAPVNSARLLTSSEAIPRLLPRMFLPYWSEAGMATALTTAERLVGRTRIVHLACRPDASAIECLERALELD